MRPTQSFLQEGLHVLAQDRDQNEDRPQPVNHARNRCQQFHEKRERPAKCFRTHFGREDSYAHRQGDSDEQGQNDETSVPKMKGRAPKCSFTGSHSLAAKNLKPKACQERPDRCTNS